MDKGPLGFPGNPDLYGLGIRIGYYTSALSIFIGNLWAPSEIYYLRHVTLVFITSVLIGVSVLSINPGIVHAIEPFMMMHVAYYNYYMGLLIPPSPDQLVWEKEYSAFFVSAVIGIALHSYDTWYWYIGQHKMLRTPGTETSGFVIHFGKVDIFGWISIPIKMYLALFLLVKIRQAITRLYFYRIEKRLDREVPPTRMKRIAEGWQKEFDSQAEMYGDNDEALLDTSHLSPPLHKRNISSRSDPAASNSLEKDQTVCDGTLSPTPQLRSSWRDEFDNKLSSEVRIDNNSTPEPGIKRTMSENLRYRLLGWQPEYNLGLSPVYTYHPTLTNVQTAIAFLDDINPPVSKCAHIFGCYFLLKALIMFPFTTLRHGLKPSLLLAIAAHYDAVHLLRRHAYIILFMNAMKHPAYRTLQAEDITLASRLFITTNKPIEPTFWQKFGWAQFLFTTSTLLVIGTELAIQWNAISGVQSLRSVGQLIPAAIGAGGLFRVIYSALFESRAEMEICMGRCKVAPRKAQWKEAGDAYLGAAEARERWEDVRRKEMSRGSTSLMIEHGDSGNEKREDLV